MNEQTILDNKRGRETAQEVAQLARLETIAMSAQARARFWEQLQFEVAKELPQAPVAAAPKQMTDAEIREFGRSIMPFGVHLGKRIDNVPIEYLDWLLGNAAEFLVKVRQYFNSPQIQAEREQ